MDIIKLEFERTPETDTEKGRRWRHKRTGRSFLQFKSMSGKSWDTGVWSKQLKIVASGGRGTMGDRILIERAKLIMQLRAKGPGPEPKDDGMCFFLFEEDLLHQLYQ